ncbi:MAG: hypothetical protein LBH30_07300 [Prevotellaceae bacterium]|nr:hypothetical protein [Prevotellaceae bacterium]
MTKQSSEKGKADNTGLLHRYAVRNDVPRDWLRRTPLRCGCFTLAGSQ